MQTKILVADNPVRFDFWPLEPGWVFEDAPFTEDIHDDDPIWCQRIVNTNPTEEQNEKT